jgi:hypothetical protein
MLFLMATVSDFKLKIYYKKRIQYNEQRRKLIFLLNCVFISSIVALFVFLLIFNMNTYKIRQSAFMIIALMQIRELNSLSPSSKYVSCDPRV